MAVVRLTGQLGTATLGSLELGAWQPLAAFVPHLARARSALAGQHPRSTISVNRARSTLSATTARSDID